MKPMKTTSTRRLRARATAMSTHDAEFDDYGPEPNMKLSHAFLVVLLLHVIAVGGLYAFNSMKANKAPKLTVAKATAPSGQPAEGAGNSGGQEPQQKEPDNRPPSREKVTPVAKTSEMPKLKQSAAKSVQAAPKATKSTENTAKNLEKSSSPVEGSMMKTENPQPHRGILAKAKEALQRLSGVGVGAATAATAVAQDTSAQTPAAAQPAESVPAGQAASTAKTYLVKAGDTITKISSALGVTILDLENANGMAGNAVLRVGQTLKVPEKMVAQAVADAGTQVSQVAGGIQQLPGTIAAATAAATASAQGSSNAPSALPDMVEYTVVKGDNPYKIAKKFKVTPDELMKANGITDPKKIQIGQKLKIPPSHKK